MKAAWASTGNMAILKMSRKIGVIAEDKSDVEVIEKILEKYVARNQFSIKPWVGNGCGKLKNKCAIWAQMLMDRGCDHVLVFHDLDRNNERTLRASLAKKLPQDKFPNSVIVVPIEELEAWLLSDSEAIRITFKLVKAPKRIENCEVISSPKEEIGKIVWAMGKKRYLNTVHNKIISQHTSLENFRRCNSFKKFDEYVRHHIFA